MKRSERLKLTEQSLAKLRKDRIPVNILVELEEVKDLEFDSIKKFLRAAEKHVGQESIKTYKAVILQHAEIITVPTKSVFREYAEALIIAVILALIIRTFIVEAFKIPSGSMIPTLLVGDHLLVNKFIYKFVEPKRHDIIVFKYPDNPSKNFIKRIIGVGGDTIEVRDKIVYVNGEKQDERYVQHIAPEIQPAQFSKRDNFGPIRVAQDAFFMMGDNRDSSLDSRFWKNQFVARRAIVGKAFIIYWSWKQDENMLVDTEEAFADMLIRNVKTIGNYLIHLPSAVRWNRLAHLIK